MKRLKPKLCGTLRIPPEALFHATITTVSDDPIELNEPKHTHTGRDLTVGSIPRHLVAFATPMLAGSALQTAYSFVNRYWVGRYLGKEAMAAVTVSMPVVFVTI